MRVRLAPALPGNLEILEFRPSGIGLEKPGSGMAWDITVQKSQGLRLLLKAFILTFRDLASHVMSKNNKSGWVKILEV